MQFCDVHCNAQKVNLGNISYTFVMPVFETSCQRCCSSCALPDISIYLLTYLDISVLGAGAIFFLFCKWLTCTELIFYVLEVCSVLLYNVFDT